MTLIIGIPNAGKTTYSAKYENVIHFDYVWSTNVYDYLAELVKNNNDLCIEGVFGASEKRKKILQESKIKNTCIWLDVPVEICLERERNGRKRSDHLVIWAAEDFEPPTLDEGWDEIIIINNENDIQHIKKE